MKTSEKIDEFLPAYFAAIAEMPNPKKDSKNPHFKHTYASLESVMDTVKPVLLKHGIAIIQAPRETGGLAASVETILMHVSAQYMSSVMVITPSKPDPQGTCGAFTYAKRYSLLAMLGLVAEEDDDGNVASDPRGSSRKASNGDFGNAGQRFFEEAQRPPTSIGRDEEDLVNDFGSRILASDTLSELETVSDEIRSSGIANGQLRSAWAARKAELSR